MKIIIIIFFALTNYAYSESIYVKYRGDVSLDGFDCRNTSSSFVNRVCYQDQDEYLIVLLGSTYYHYCKVPDITANRWLSSSSKGSFYNSSIKGRFDCRLGGIPE